MLLGNVAAMLLFYPLSRFRAPLLAGLIPFAALALVRTVDLAAAGRRMAAGLAVVAALALGLWIGRPLPAGRSLLRTADCQVPFVFVYWPQYRDAAGRGDWRAAAGVALRALEGEPEAVRRLRPGTTAATADDRGCALAYAEFYGLAAEALERAGEPRGAGIARRRGDELAAAAAALSIERVSRALVCGHDHARAVEGGVPRRARARGVRVLPLVVVEPRPGGAVPAGGLRRALHRRRDRPRRPRRAPVRPRAAGELPGGAAGVPAAARRPAAVREPALGGGVPRAARRAADRRRAPGLDGPPALLVAALAAGAWRGTGPRPGERALALAATLSFPMLFVTLYKGQVSLIVLVSLLGWWRGLREDDDRRTGLCLVAFAVKPQLFLVPILVTALRRRLRALAWFAAGAVAVALVTLAVTGPGPFVDFLGVTRTLRARRIDATSRRRTRVHVQLPRLRHPVGGGAAGSRSRYAGRRSPRPWDGRAPVASGAPRSEAPDDRLVALSLLLAIFFTPHLYFYDTLVLVGVAAPFYAWLRRVDSTRATAFLLVALSRPRSSSRPRGSRSGRGSFAGPWW